MIMRPNAPSKRATVVLALILAILQLAIVPNVGILGGRANLPLVFVACACLGGDAERAAAIGFAAGLFYDLSGSGPIGLMALLLTVVAWLLASMGRPLITDDLSGSVVLFAGVALGVGLAYALVLLACGISSSAVDAIFLRAVPGALIDCVCLAITGLILSRATGASGGLSFSGGSRGSGHLKVGKGL